MQHKPRRWSEILLCQPFFFKSVMIRQIDRSPSSGHLSKMSKAKAKQREQQQEVAQSCGEGGRRGATAPLKGRIGCEISPVDS